MGGEFRILWHCWYVLPNLLAFLMAQRHTFHGHPMAWLRTLMVLEHLFYETWIQVYCLCLSPSLSHQWWFSLKHQNATNHGFSLPQWYSPYASDTKSCPWEMANCPFCDLSMFHLTAKSSRHLIKICLVDNYPELWH